MLVQLGSLCEELPTLAFVLLAARCWMDSFTMLYQHCGFHERFGTKPVVDVVGREGAGVRIVCGACAWRGGGWELGADRAKERG